MVGVSTQVEGKKAHSIVLAEREALKLLAEHRNPFCMHLVYAYEKADEFCLVMPLAIGRFGCTDTHDLSLSLSLSLSHDVLFAQGGTCNSTWTARVRL